MKKVLLTGSTGFLGRYLVDELRRRDVELVTAGRDGCDVELDLADLDGLPAAVQGVAPDFVINCAAMSSMAACQAKPTVALRVNGKSPQILASACGCRFLQLSTDLVFDGDDAPYDATGTPRPLSVYGMSKAEAETISCDDWLAVRLPLLFGPSFDGQRGATDMLRQGVGAKERPVLFTDEFRTPLHAADASLGIVDLLFDPDTRGIRHLGGHERVSRWEFARRFCAVAGIEGDVFRAGASEDPRRPKDVSLVGDWNPARDLDAALADC